LASRLRVGLEGRLAGDGEAVGLSAPAVVTKGRITAALACDQHALPHPVADCTPSIPMACGALVGVLFRQLVTVGRLGDPMDDGMAGLSVDDHHQALVAWITRLERSERAGLASEVRRQARGIEQRWPPLDAGWLPRTQQRLRVPLLGGAVQLSARVDLALGAPPVAESSVAFVDVKSGMPRAEHRADLHYYALLETLRTGAPPFAVATYYTRTGELDVEPVTGSLLFSAAHRTMAGIRVLLRRSRDAEPTRRKSSMCAWCQATPGEADLSGGGDDADADGDEASWTRSGTSVVAGLATDRTAA
jgi:hypothetical protein